MGPLPATASIQNPWGLLPESSGLLGAPLVLAIPLCALSLVARYRSSTVEVRQQLRWIAFAAIVVAIGLIATMVIDATTESQAGWPLYLGAIAIVVASGIAVLGYHLWDLDVVVNRSLVYGLVTVVTSAAYVAIVAGFGRLFTTSSLAVSLVATVAIALAILPISGAMQRWVNRLMYGAREDPYGALARLGDRLARSPETESVLNTIVDTIAESLRVPYVSVQIRNGPIVEIAARPAIGEWANRINLHIEYHGEAIGKLVVAPRSPRDP